MRLHLPGYLPEETIRAIVEVRLHNPASTHACMRAFNEWARTHDRPTVSPAKLKVWFSFFGSDLISHYGGVEGVVREWQRLKEAHDTRVQLSKTRNNRPVSSSTAKAKLAGIRKQLPLEKQRMLDAMIKYGRQQSLSQIARGLSTGRYQVTVVKLHGFVRIFEARYGIKLPRVDRMRAIGLGVRRAMARNPHRFGVQHSL